MILKCGPKDEYGIFFIINEAAKLYDGVIPDDCYHVPYMPIEELRQEMKDMTFYGYERDYELIGVMGIQSLSDVTLIRHSYVLSNNQHKGIGSILLNYLIQIAPTKCLLVGTWRDAKWAIRFYEKHGFKLLTNKDDLLRKYWNISERQIEASVVLGIAKTSELKT